VAYAVRAPPSPSPERPVVLAVVLFAARDMGRPHRAKLA